MAKIKKSKKRLVSSKQLDSVYFLKIVLYLVVGAQWLWFIDKSGNTRFPLPIGLIIGVLFASHDHFRLDRKIEYAMLLIAMFIGYALQSGIFITV